MIEVCAWTHPGLVRKRNEDVIVCPGIVLTDRPESPIVLSPRSIQHAVFAVVDGMGGHAGGQEASRAIALGLAGNCADISATLQQLHEGLFDEMRRRPELSAMGATAAGIYIADDAVQAFNIGDSRVYTHRTGYLTLVTEDDRDVGRPGVVTQSLGGTREPMAIEVHTVDLDVVPPFRVLVCSDGLSEVVSFAQIQDALDLPTPEHSVRELIDITCQGGAPDNVSVIVIEWTTLESAQGPPN